MSHTRRSSKTVRFELPPSSTVSSASTASSAGPVSPVYTYYSSPIIPLPPVHMPVSPVGAAFPQNHGAYPAPAAPISAGQLPQPQPALEIHATLLATHTSRPIINWSMTVPPSKSSCQNPDIISASATNPAVKELTIRIVKPSLFFPWPITVRPMKEGQRYIQVADLLHAVYDNLRKPVGEVEYTSHTCSPAYKSSIVTACHARIASGPPGLPSMLYRIDYLLGYTMWGGLAWNLNCGVLDLIVRAPGPCQ